MSLPSLSSSEPRLEARFRKQCDSSDPPNSRRYIFYDVAGNDVRSNYLHMVLGRVEATFASVFSVASQFNYETGCPSEFRQLAPDNALVVCWKIGKIISNYTEQTSLESAEYAVLQQRRLRLSALLREPPSPDNEKLRQTLRRDISEDMSRAKQRAMKWTRLLTYTPAPRSMLHSANWPRLKSTRSGALRAHQVPVRANILSDESLLQHSYPLHTLSFVVPTLHRQPKNKYVPTYMELEVAEIESRALGRQSVPVYVPVSLYAGIFPKHANEPGVGVFVDAEDIYTTNVEYDELVRPANADDAAADTGAANNNRRIDLTAQIYGGPRGHVYKLQAPAPVPPLFVRPDAPAFIDTMLAAVARYAIPGDAEEFGHSGWRGVNK